ncbi:MAG: SAP domain-containing protein [Clostridiales bacterium]|nr:SAP domain-containing protein [Clostridiales bacterium]
MGLFKLFKGKDISDIKELNNSNKDTVIKLKESYYQPDEYYTDVIAENTPFERKVVTFDERKKTAIPSKGGLYPAEILLLHYCSYGDYPKPRNGYPGFWWFEYGIRDVEKALKSLEERSFITFASVKDSLSSLTVVQLKEILSSQNLPLSGKKKDLMQRIADNVSEDVISLYGVEPKYKLTDLGNQELKENEYVPYMHKTSHKTRENDRGEMTFNVWSINALLDPNDKTNWKEIVDDQENKLEQQTQERNDKFMNQLKEIDIEAYEELQAQDEQLSLIQKTDESYQTTKDLNSYISFWEDLWKNGGLKFNGVSWCFKLADLYIKAKRYDDALDFVSMIKETKPDYAYKANTYIERINKLRK